MSTDLILKAANIITMDDDRPFAEAVAIDTAKGTIEAVGSLEEVTAAVPSVQVRDLGSSVLVPGFIDPHSHPALGGMVTQEPAYWIAPYMGYPTYEDVQKLWRKLDSELPEGQAVLCNGLDRLLQGAPELTNVELDEFFPKRPAVILDNSGHEAYFNSAVIQMNGWDGDKPPSDPVGARYGRNSDGTSNGRAYETAAVLAATQKVLAQAVPHPLMSMARWYTLMSRNGIIASTEHTYQSDMLKAFIACASVPESLLRIALYHMSIEPDCGEHIESPVPETMLWKQGIKLWADGSPWVGTIAASFPYLDTKTVRDAQIPLGPGGEQMMNYSRDELDQILDKHAAQGWQFAFHVNGDIGLDIVLDAYERALTEHNLLGSDHRWRVEHCGACRGDQFDRAARLGVTISLSQFQFIYWGDLLDGTMFPPEIGGQWMRMHDAFKSGAVVTTHNDGPVSPPSPLLNIQTMVTRRTPSGKVHGPQQQISLNEALKTHTTNAAYQIGRDHDLGSIQVGKLADFVELSTDLYRVNPENLTEEVKVLGTWLGGKKVDPDAFLNQIQEIDPTEHKDLAKHAAKKSCC